MRAPMPTAHEDVQLSPRSLPRISLTVDMSVHLPACPHQPILRYGGEVFRFDDGLSWQSHPPAVRAMRRTSGHARPAGEDPGNPDDILLDGSKV
jgi:hypothetical protein